MRRFGYLASVAALGLSGALAGMAFTGALIAQDAPESILPPGFDDPAPAPTPAPAPAPPPSGGQQGTTGGGGRPSVSPGTRLPGTGPSNLPPAPRVPSRVLSRIPTVEELENMSTDQLDDLLGLKPRFDIPPAARRSLSQVGLLGPSEGGLPTGSLRNQPPKLVRAILAGTKGPLVSRWGHILLRRALVSRMAAPEGMSPVAFAALRAGVLNRIGEYTAVRGLVQDVDTGNWNKALTNEALTAYTAASDLVGACPAIRLQGSVREDAQWVMWQAICNAYAGESALAGSQLNEALNEEIAPEIDVLLAQRYAAASGRARRGVEIEWDGVEEINPWRFALANAVGETLPDGLLDEAPVYYDWAGATGAAVPLEQRAGFADRAAREGILSSRAMVSLYSAIYSDGDISGEYATRAGRLRNAYVAQDPAARVAAMRGLWGTLNGERETPAYAMSVLTAYAAARVTPNSQFERYSGELIASMLTAGLDRDAQSWSNVVDEGSLGWALIALASPEAGNASEDGVDSFIGSDGSEGYRKSAFLVAGLGGLGRISSGQLSEFASRLDWDPSRETRWTQMIDRAAQVENRALVAMLAGLGMQGSSWDKMTPLHLYHITSALRRVGLEAEARMIAAEAVARV